MQQPTMFKLPAAVSIVFVALTIAAKGEQHWCKISDTSSTPANDGWLYYDDQDETCVTCSRNSVTLISKQNLDFYECCGGVLTIAGSCVSQKKQSGFNCTNALRCDGRKQCVQGSDESGCGSCRNTFACQDKNELKDITAKVCVQQEQVCDSKKDCRLGLDETGCKWHNGWCEGFLCGKSKEKCIATSQVCDGIKDCVDGSDEYNCEFCDSQFRCQLVERSDIMTAQCVGTFRICDGIQDCENNLDETNCFRWTEWSQWSSCNRDSSCLRNRSRACLDGRTSLEVDPKNCMVIVNNETVVVPQYEYETTRATPTGSSVTDEDLGTTDDAWLHVTITQGIPVRLSFNKSLAIILAFSIVAGVLILLLLFCVIFYLCERRKKRGFWTPKKDPQERAVKVPKMYYDIPLDDKISKKQLPTTQRNIESPAMSSFAALVKHQQSNDSGIDETRSTSSSHVDEVANQSALNLPITQGAFSGNGNPNFEPEAVDVFPPPPPGIAT